MFIEIEELVDEYECDDCGWSVSQGYRVRFNGSVVIQLQPVAHCYNGTHYTQQDLLEAILLKLGHEVEFL